MNTVRESSLFAWTHFSRSQSSCFHQRAYLRLTIRPLQFGWDIRVLKTQLRKPASQVGFMKIAVWLFCQSHHRNLVWDRPLGCTDLTYLRILGMTSKFYLHRTEVTGFPVRCTVLVWPCLSIGSCPPNWQSLWGYLGKKSHAWISQLFQFFLMSH